MPSFPAARGTTSFGHAPPGGPAQPFQTTWPQYQQRRVGGGGLDGNFAVPLLLRGVPSAGSRPHTLRPRPLAEGREDAAADDGKREANWDLGQISEPKAQEGAGTMKPVLTQLASRRRVRGAIGGRDTFADDMHLGFKATPTAAARVTFVTLIKHVAESQRVVKIGVRCRRCALLP